MSDDTKSINPRLGRRAFLKATGASGVAFALTGLGGPKLLQSAPATAAMAAPSDEKIIPTQCGICPGNCGVNAYVKNGRLVRVEGLPGHPQSVLCTRGNAAVQHVYSAARIKYPMKRTGERGEGKFQRITWDEAMDTIANKMKDIKAKDGPQAVAGGGSRGLLGPGINVTALPWRLLAAFGSPNWGSTAWAHCHFSWGQASPLTTAGQHTVPDFGNTKGILLWGCEPSNDSPPIMQPIMDAKQRGAKLFVIDIKISDSGAKADMFVGVRPGSDGALALAFLNVVIKEGLYDRDFVANWTVGFDELKEYVQQYTPEKVSELTWVPVDKIYAMARAIATTKPLCMLAQNGLEFHTSGLQALRATRILFALTGNLDALGGNVFAMPGIPLNTYAVEDQLPAQPAPIGKEKYPFLTDNLRQSRSVSWPEAILEGKPYPLKMIIQAGQSSVTQIPETPRTIKALKALEFLVVMDRFMTSDAYYADIVLPACTYYEQATFATYTGLIQCREQAIEPLGEAWPDIKFWLTLAQKLGLTERFPWKTQEELCDYVLQPSGFNMAKLRENLQGIPVKATPMVYKKYEKGLLRKDGKPGFNTPSGKFEIRSSLLEKYGYDGLPVWKEPEQSPFSMPELAKQFPLVLDTGSRVHTAFHSQHRHVPWLVEIDPAPQAVMNPKVAQPRGIKDGDAVIVATPKGEVRVRAKVTERIIPGIVEVYAGGGNQNTAPEWRDGNVNMVTDNAYGDPISGFRSLKSLLCEVRKA